MEQKTLYTAIGRLERETNGCGRSCPIIRLGGQPYMVDMQELVVWTALNWRISKWEDISFQCDKLASSMGGAVSRPWDDCVNRLLTRGLLVSGCGETEYDALYDLLSPWASTCEVKSMAEDKNLQKKLPQLRLKKLLQQKLLLNKFQQIPNKKSGKAINPLRSAGGDFFIVFCYKTYQIIYSVQNKMPFFASA